jgi:hypothetical protein
MNYIEEFFGNEQKTFNDFELKVESWYLNEFLIVLALLGVVGSLGTFEFDLVEC